MEKQTVQERRGKGKGRRGSLVWGEGEYRINEMQAVIPG